MKRLAFAVVCGAVLALIATMLLRPKLAPAAASAPSSVAPAPAPVAVGAPQSEPVAPQIAPTAAQIAPGAAPAQVPVAPAQSGAEAFGFGAASVVDPEDPNADPLSAWGPAPAPTLDPRRFSEAHWQGLELIPKTPALSKALKLPQSIQGVIVDDVSLPADLQGFVAGDVVLAIDRVSTPNLTSFIQATDAARERHTAELSVFRKGDFRQLVLSALFDRLGTANGETPGMIPASARSPHPYQGACTTCHKVGSTGSLVADQGDTVAPTAPPIRAAAPAPHRDRGTCTACHQVLP